MRQHVRRLDLHIVAAPDVERSLLEQEGEADGEQHLPQRIETEGRRNTRSITSPISATAKPATGMASSHDPVVQITDSAT